MLEIIPFEEGNVIGLRLDGRIEDQELDQVTEQIEDMLKDHDKLRIYLEFEEFGTMSVNTFMKNLHLKLTHWHYFEKEAVVSDKGWLESWIEIADKLFPYIEVKHFSMDEKKEAKEWLRQ